MAVKQIRLILRGHNGGGNSWSIGLSISGKTDGVLSDYIDWLTAIESDVKDSFNSGGSGWGGVAASNTTFQGMDAYIYDSAGHPATNLATHDFASAVTGAGSHATPFYCAAVASLRNGLPGRHNRGRIYLPADGAALTNSQLTSTQANTLATGVSTLCGVINSSTPAGEPCNVQVAGPGQTVLNRVSEVRVDTLLDVQHRRQDKVTAAATATASVS